MDIKQESFNNLSSSNNHFDLITDFDTINFWDDIEHSIREVKRVSKQNGLFFIINGYPKKGSKWYDFVKLKDEQEYKSFLSNLGFQQIEIIIKNQTIIISAKIKKGDGC